MSCNGCRVLRKGCSETCILRPCLQWIDGAEAQGNATLFVAKFFGRTGLTGFISSVPDSQRPVLFKSLLYEACGRTVNPVYGAVGLLWSGDWHICQDAVKMVFNGGNPHPVSPSAPCSIPVAGEFANIPPLNLHRFHTREQEPILPNAQNRTKANVQPSAYQLESEIHIERLGSGGVDYPAMPWDCLNSVKSIKRSLGAILDTNLSLSCHQTYDDCKDGKTDNTTETFQQQINFRKRQLVHVPTELTLPIAPKPQAIQPPCYSTEDIVARRNPNISEVNARNIDLQLSLSLHASSNAVNQKPGINNKQPSHSSSSVNSEGSITSLDTADFSFPHWPFGGGGGGSWKLLQLLRQRQATQMNKQTANSQYRTILNSITAP